MSSTSKPTLEWAQLLLASGKIYAYGVAFAKDGSILVTGQAGASINSSPYGGSGDTYLANLDSKGNVQWVTLTNDPNGDYGRAIAVDSLTGNTYVVGGVYAGGRNGSIFKFSPSGTLNTSSLLTRATFYDASTVTIGNETFLYVVGEYDSSNVGGKYDDGVIAKYNVSNLTTPLWTKLIGDYGFQRAYGVAVDDNGNAYVSGTNSGVNTIAGGKIDGLESTANDGGFVKKYDSDGNGKWTVLVGSAGSVEVSSDQQSVFVAGSRGSEGRVLKLDASNGSTLWQTSITASPSTAGVTPYGSTISSNELFVVGETSGVLDSQAYRGKGDLFLSTVGADSGQLMQTTVAGTTESDYAWAVAVGAGKLVAVGSTYGSLMGLAGPQKDQKGTLLSGAFITQYALTTSTVVAPKIDITTNQTKLNASQTATVTFNLTASASDFVEGDLKVSGGTLSNFKKDNETTYTVTFTPTQNSTSDGTVSVLSRTFSTSSGDFNFDGEDSNNSVTISVDTVIPSVSIQANPSVLDDNGTSDLTFTLSEASTNFTENSIKVVGGTLSGFAGSGSIYKATFQVIDKTDKNSKGSVSVASSAFTDLAGNFNSDGSDSDNTVSLIFCFLKGTEIRLANGSSATAVETLASRQALSSFCENPATITWIGYQRRTPEFAQFQDYLPVKISAGALEDNIPIRDLYLSPDHAVLIDGHLIHAKALVNGKTITQMSDWVGDIEYYHIETEAHEIIYAEGVPCETFIDNVSREQFDNYAEYQALYPNTRMMKELPLPRIKFKRQLPIAIRQRLEQRAGALQDLKQG